MRGIRRSRKQASSRVYTPVMKESEPDSDPRMRRRYIGVVICEVVVIAALWLLSHWFR